MRRSVRTVFMLSMSALAVRSGVRASCNSYLPIHSAVSGTYTYTHVETPGVCPNGPPCSEGTSVTSSFRGSFWALGYGDPAPNQGIDSGVWQPLAPRPGGTGWTYALPGDPLLLWGNWDDPRVDGCAFPGTCTAVLLGDQSAAGDRGYFAILTDRANDGAFEYGGPGVSAIRLAEMPTPRILSSQRLADHMEIRLDAPSLPAGGSYLDPGCPPGTLLGYKVYESYRYVNQPLPDRSREGWTAVAQGGTAPGGGPIPMGSPTTLILPWSGCGPAIQWLLAYAFVFDSGFETPFVSRNVAVNRYSIVCTVDADCDGICEFCECGIHDCDDGNPAVAPGALQVCDHLNNDCNDPHWPSLVGTNEDGPDVDGDSWTGLCDNCPSVSNAGQQDADADGVGDACDDCPLLSNPEQRDRDADGQGDLCDLDDASIVLWVDGGNLVRWQQESPFTGWNLYRGDLGALRGGGDYTQAPGSNPVARRDCGLPDPSAIDPDLPLVGHAAFYLVTGVAGGSEGSLGTNSAGVDRPNAHPCP